jgi:osmotically-inducible protein OsmY
MTPFNKKKNATFAAFLLLGSLSIPLASAQSTDANGTKPDNSKVNQQERSAGRTTADQQKMNATDRALTRKVRRALMADKTLSTYAHNVKIISQEGMVTLKGPVRSEAEKAAVEAKASEAVGTDAKITNELTVAPKSK